MKRTVIIGAGPTGLGAAWRLQEIGNTDWTLLEANDNAGGLASSFTDKKGFTWDIGGHVQFSHYDYFDDALDEFLGRDGWLYHDRQSLVCMRDRFIPYPFQNNLHRLPLEDLDKCLAGLVDITTNRQSKPTNFYEWILANFGRGIAEIFMLPYNFKVWAYPADMLNTAWVGERVSVTDLKRVLHNCVYRKDDISWGPNNRFRFPLRGGTGAIWSAAARRLPVEKVLFNMRVSQIDLEKRNLTTANGQTFAYETLISTIPLTVLIRLSRQRELAEVATHSLLHSSTYVFGAGLKGTPPEHLRTTCWMYFPEDNCPFYRTTVFSNYSPNNVPGSGSYWSLMAEVSESPYKPMDHARLQEEVIAGLLATKLIHNRDEIVSLWQYHAQYGYPTPAIRRDWALAQIIPFFESKGVRSRGRFGLWKYEVSNQDHSFMQGVEVVENLLHGSEEVTAFDSQHANSRKHSWPFERWQGHQLG